MLSLANGISAKAVNSISGHLSAALPTVMLPCQGSWVYFVCRSKLLARFQNDQCAPSDRNIIPANSIFLVNSS